jgi:hypothetical protein
MGKSKDRTYSTKAMSAKPFMVVPCSVRQMAVLRSPVVVQTKSSQ